jgi:hypothetical protein
MHFNSVGQIVVSHGDVWALSIEGGFKNRGEVTEVDATTGKVLRTLGQSRYQFNNPEAMLLVGQRLWVDSPTTQTGDIVHDAGVLTEIDASTGRLDKIIRGAHAQLTGDVGVVAVGGKIWTIASISPQMNGYWTIVDAKSGHVEGLRIPGADLGTPNTGAATSGGGNVWIFGVNHPYVTIFNGTTGDLVRQFTLPKWYQCELGPATTAGNTVYVVGTYCLPNERSSVFTFDARTTKLTGSYGSSFRGSSLPTGVAMTPLGLVVSNAKGGIDFVSETRRRAVREIPLSYVQGIASFGKTLWVIDHGQDSLSKIDLTRGKTLLLVR